MWTYSRSSTDHCWAATEMISQLCLFKGFKWKKKQPTRHKWHNRQTNSVVKALFVTEVNLHGTKSCPVTRNQEQQVEQRHRKQVEQLEMSKQFLKLNRYKEWSGTRHTRKDKKSAADAWEPCKVWFTRGGRQESHQASEAASEGTE